jgi:hypothetical protein
MKCGPFLRGRLPWSLLLGVALAGPALGDPITVYFDGTVFAGEHRGLAAPPTGVPVLTADLFGVGGALGVVNQSANGTRVSNGTPAPNQVTSMWAVENLYGDFGNPVYLLFAQLENHPMLPTVYDVDFTDEPDSQADDHAGLVIDPQLGWRIFQTVVDIDDVPTPFYYVGVPLGSFTNAGMNCGGFTLVSEQTCVAVTYFLENPGANLFAGVGSEQVLGLPQLQIMMAVIPEPATASLLGLGLAGLAAARRRRS